MTPSELSQGPKKGAPEHSGDCCDICNAFIIFVLPILSKNQPLANHANLSSFMFLVLCG